MTATDKKEVTTRTNSVQPHFGRQQGHAMGTLPTGISGIINSTEQVTALYGSLETGKERKAFFDAFLKRQRSGFSEAWMCIYQTVDLIRTNDWYWKDAGFESFEAFWQTQGEALFGRWAELEATYQYAHMAAPQLFEVNYDEAKALAQQLAPFRVVQAAKKQGGQDGNDNAKNESRDHAIGSPVNAEHFVAELAGDEFMRGYEEGQKVRSRGEDRFRRFARLRRDSPDVADKFLAGDFVRRFKNGKPPEPDMVAAEVAAGIRDKDAPRQAKRDGVAYCQKLASKFNTAQLTQLQNFINQLLESRK
jgi:hypothetical protein